jgi:hypothetical protein
MRLKMRITPLRPGTAEAVDEPKLFPCPADLGYDQILSFLVQLCGEEPVEVAWTSTERHERLTVGWIFAALPDDSGEPVNDVELLCVPVIDGEDGAVRPLFEVLADQRLGLEQLAARDVIDSLTILDVPPREYERHSGNAA